jgi:hypothetical protein
MEWNATVTFAPDALDDADTDTLDAVLDRLDGLHAAISRAPDGRVELVLTLVANTLTYAAGFLIGRAELAIGASAISAEVLPTAEFDARNSST